MTRKKRLILFWLCTLIFFVAVVPLLLYAFGYRFSFETWQLLRAGGLSIHSTPSTGTSIYLDRHLEKETTLFSRRLFLQGLTPRTYNIRIEKEGYFPWEKSLAVKPELVTDIDALLIKDSPAVPTLIQGPYTSLAFTDESEQYIRLSRQRGSVIFSTEKKQLVASPKITASSTSDVPPAVSDFIKTNKIDRFIYDPFGNRLLWWDTHTITVRWFGGESFLPIYTDVPEVEILETPYDLRNVIFYPGQDAVLASYSNGVFAIELDGRDKRHIYPFYKGKEPNFVASRGDKIVYILDDGNLVAIPLE